MKKIIDKFQAVDENGSFVELVISQEMISVKHQTGSDVLPGMKEVFTSTGLCVNRIDDETFQVVQTGQILRKV